jgi:hypothetical protein
MKNWQQAGILLSEDSAFAGKVLRLSIAYNDFFGGYEKPPEIIIQGISSSESRNESKPEEFVHFPIFTIEPGHESVVKTNLLQSSLKIERRGTHFRFLYAAGSTEIFAFKEVLSAEFNIEPNFIGLFAIQGLSPTEDPMPARFDSFSFVSTSCRE